MVETSVVRLGPNHDNMSATLLRTALVSHFQGLGNSSNTNDDSTDTTMIDDKSGLTLTISNKYFTAKVLLDEIGATKTDTGNSTTSTTTTTTTSKEDGVILVFDALQSNPDRPSTDSPTSATFDSLPLAHEETENKDGAGDLLRLCVGVTLTSPSSAEELRGQHADKEYSRRILWCLDRGYEYVEADLSQEGQARGHNERDKEGFARIVEAIQGTVWSSAVMSQSKTKQLKTSYQEDRSSALIGEEKQEEKEEENPYEPPDPSKFGTIPSVSTEGPTTTTTTSADEGATEQLLLDPEEVGPIEMAALRQDLEADQLFDKMEGVLREASRIRDASKSGEMTDDERRDRAGDAAMALVNLMSQFGLDEDDGSEMDNSSGDDDDDSGVAAGGDK